MPSFPDLTQFWMEIYGGYGFDCSAGQYLGLATGIPQTGNPPYAVNDLLAMYPKFFGTALQISCTLTATNSTVPVTSVVGLAVGQLVTGQGIPSSTIIVSVGTNSVVLSSAPTVSGAITLNFYTSQLVPLAIIQVYLNLAYASLMSSRWREAWTLAMSLYIAHFLTLYLQTDGNPQTTASQAVANGLQQGITVSQGADGLSQGLQLLGALDSWAAWTLTSYGVQLATMARVVGAGATYYQ